MRFQVLAGALQVTTIVEDGLLAESGARGGAAKGLRFAEIPTIEPLSKRRITRRTGVKEQGRSQPALVLLDPDVVGPLRARLACAT